MILNTHYFPYKNTYQVFLIKKIFKKHENIHALKIIQTNQYHILYIKSYF